MSRQWRLEPVSRWLIVARAAGALWALLIAAAGLSAAPLRLTLDASRLQIEPGQEVVAVIAVHAVDQPAAGSQAAEAPTLAPEEEAVIDLAPGVDWRVGATAAGYWSQEQTIRLTEAGGSLRFELLPAGTIHGTLSPAPAAGPREPLRVELARPPSSARPADAWRARVDCPVEAGSWRCGVPAGVFDLSFRLEGLLPVYRWEVEIEAEKALDLGEIRTPPGATVVGRVVTEDGEPASEDCTLYLIRKATEGQDPAPPPQRRAPGPRTGMVGGRGNFQVVAVEPGTYVVKAMQPGLEPAISLPFEVAEDTESVLAETLVLLSPVKLELVFNPPVDPFSNPWQFELTEVHSESRGRSQPIEGTATEFGTWVQESLKSGTYELTLAGSVNSRWFQQTIKVERGQPPVEVAIPVIGVVGTVKVGDSAVQGIVQLTKLQPRYAASFDTGDSGGFAGLLPREGPWDAKFLWEAAGLELTYGSVDVKVPRDDTVARLNLRFPDTTLMGEVVDLDGAPIVGASINVMWLQSRQLAPGKFKSDREGQFRIVGLAPGAVAVRARLKGAADSRWVHTVLEVGAEPTPVVLIVSRRKTGLPPVEP